MDMLARRHIPKDKYRFSFSIVTYTIYLYHTYIAIQGNERIITNRVQMLVCIKIFICKIIPIDVKKIFFLFVTSNSFGLVVNLWSHSSHVQLFLSICDFNLILNSVQHHHQTEFRKRILKKEKKTRKENHLDE